MTMHKLESVERLLH